MYASSNLCSTAVLRIKTSSTISVVCGPSTGNVRARLAICHLRRTRAGAQRPLGAESEFVEKGQRRGHLTNLRSVGVDAGARGRAQMERRLRVVVQQLPLVIAIALGQSRNLAG